MAHDRTEQPVVVPDGSQARSFHESIRFNVGDETIRDRTEQPVLNCDESSHEQTMLNEVRGLPNSRITTFCCDASGELSCS